MRNAVERRLHRLARLDDAVDPLAARQLERELPRRLVPLRPDLHQLRKALAVREPSVAVEEPEAAVADDARARELDLVRMDEMERLHGRDRDADDGACHHREAI